MAATERERTDNTKPTQIVAWETVPQVLILSPFIGCVAEAPRYTIITEFHRSY